MTDAATAHFASAAEIQKRPISDAQWADAVEAYQRAKLMKDAVDDLARKAFAQQSGNTSAQIRFALKARADSKESEARDDLQGRLELLGVGSERAPYPFLRPHGPRNPVWRKDADEAD